MMDLTVGADAAFIDVKTLIWQRTGYPVDKQVLLYASSSIFPSAARTRPVTTLC
jgi:hypothetical protein